MCPDCWVFNKGSILPKAEATPRSTVAWSLHELTDDPCHPTRYGVVASSNLTSAILFYRERHFSWSVLPLRVFCIFWTNNALRRVCAARYLYSNACSITNGQAKTISVFAFQSLVGVVSSTTPLRRSGNDTGWATWRILQNANDSSFFSKLTLPAVLTASVTWCALRDSKPANKPDSSRSELENTMKKRLYKKDEFGRRADLHLPTGQIFLADSTQQSLKELSSLQSDMVLSLALSPYIWALW